MPRLKANEVPTLRHHRASGRAVVTLSGRDHYCGAWGTPEAETVYRGLVAEWLARGRRPAPAAGEYRVRDLAREYGEHCLGRYRKRGRPTRFATQVGAVMRDLVAMYGDVPAADLGPLRLRALRHRWLEPAEGSGRRAVAQGTANGYARLVQMAYRWAAAEEKVPAEASGRVAALVPLRKGRDPGRVDPPVGPVAEADFLATLPHLRRVPKAVALLMWHTGMRPGEACHPRARDIDRSRPVWEYVVPEEWNKTAHRGKSRTVALGPRAQMVLVPFLEAAGEGYLFRPPGKSTPYSTVSLARAVRVACRKAGVPLWKPNQLRHAAATRIRALKGLDAARAVLGHSDVGTSLIYAERDMETLREIAEEML
jgi:integrase